MKRLSKFFSKYGIYVIISFCLILGLSALLFKNATMDDDLYLWETSMMTEALSRGQWFGDYAVGTHGFLFKLPVALVFLLTGPLLSIATIWNIFLACASLYLFYKILEFYFGNSIYPFLGSLLLFCNFQFILNLPTYMREFPVFLSVIILIYVLINKKSYWIVGLALLLILDGKEYVFFMILPAFLFYVLFLEWKGFKFKTLVGYIKSCIQIFLPTVIFFLLMIFTSFVPLNMHALSVIPGVTEGGVEYQIRHFDPEVATTNRIEEDAPTIQKEIVQEDDFFERVYKVVISYVGKILYPRSFSFLSIPKMIFFPAFLTSILLFKKALKRKDYPFISLSLILWSFTSVFVLRASFDRYLFSILPVVVFFFLIFIKDLVKEKKRMFPVIAVSGAMSLIGLLFEVDYLEIKVVLNILITIGYVLYCLLHNRGKNLHIVLVLLLSMITFSVVAFFFYANGQLHEYLLWGHDYEVKKVVSHFEDEERIILNDVGWDILVKVYRGDNQYNPEWKWELAEWVPRKERLKMFEKFTSYNMYGKSIKSDRSFIESNNITKIGLLVSTLENMTFPYQERLDDYLKADWVRLIEMVELKNKNLYVFEVLKE